MDTLDQFLNQLFGNQVFDWLATPVFLSVNPTSGTVPAGVVITARSTRSGTEAMFG